MGISVDEFAEKNNLESDQVIGEKKISGNLLLYDVNELPEPFTPIIEGHLRLNALEKVPSGFAPSVGKSLDLSSAENLPDNSDLTKIKGTIYLNNLKELPTNFNVKNDGDLWLNSLEKLNENFPSDFKGSLMLPSLLDLNGNNTLKTQGSLWLNSIKELPENITLNVGGALNLKALEKLPENWNFSLKKHLLCENEKLRKIIGRAKKLTAETRFFIADAIFKTWKKIYVLTSDGTLYSEYLDYMRPVTDRRTVDFSSFAQEDYSFGGYQKLREVSKSEATSAVLTRQGNWVSSYLNRKIK